MVFTGDQLFLSMNQAVSICLQGRREPDVGPGSAQILGISGFVYSTTQGENATVFSGF